MPQKALQTLNSFSTALFHSLLLPATPSHALFSLAFSPLHSPGLHLQYLFAGFTLLLWEKFNPWTHFRNWFLCIVAAAAHPHSLLRSLPPPSFIIHSQTLQLNLCSSFSHYAGNCYNSITRFLAASCPSPGDLTLPSPPLHSSLFWFHGRPPPQSQSQNALKSIQNLCASAL